MSDRTGLKSFICVIIIGFLVMVGLSYMTPICIDDLWLEPLTSANPFERWKVALDLYKNHTGRMISQELWLFVLAHNKWVYIILNSTIYTAFVLLIYRYILVIACGRKYNASLLLGIYVFLWFFTPTYGGIYLWRSASCTYLWTIIFALTIGFFYFAEIFGEKKTDSKENSIIKSMGLFFLGLMGGWSHEEISATLCMGMIAYIAHHIIKHQKIRLQKMFGIIGAFLGAALLILDPANFTRAGTVAESSSIIMRYFYRIARETFYFLRFLTIPFGIACVLLYVLAIKRKESRFLSAIKKHSGIAFLIILTFLSVYVMTFSAGFALRIFITPVALLAIALGSEIKILSEDDYVKENALRFLVGVFSIACAVEMVLAVYTARSTGNLIYRDTIYYSSEEDNIFNK